jgi:hypothetical protein
MTESSNVIVTSVPMEEDTDSVNNTTVFSPTSTQTVRCGVCSLKASLYKCPGCSVTTCSCECVKQHKIQSGCNGKRNRAEFVAKSEFTDQNLRSDYHFLEDTLQLRTSAQRTAGKSFGGGLTSKTMIKSAAESAHTMEEVMSAQQRKGGGGGQQHSQSAAKLVKGAKEHGVELALMPSGMTKRKHNTSRYHKKVGVVCLSCQLVVRMKIYNVVGDLLVFHYYVILQEDKIYWKVQVNFILSAGFAMPSALSFDLRGLDAGGSVVGLCSEARMEVDEDALLGGVLASFLETTSVREEGAV